MVQVVDIHEFVELKALVESLQKEVEYLKDALPELLTVQQAAEKLDRCDKVVLKMFHSGKLKGIQEGKKIQIYFSSIRDHQKKYTPER